MKFLLACIEIALGIASLVIFLPACAFFLEIIFGLMKHRSPAPTKGERPRLAVLVPAHNEASIIHRTLRSIVPGLNPADRLVVIADNCSDETADIASREGAEVIRRTDLERRGKGYALDFGIRHLEIDAPDVVVIIDADCVVERGAIDRIAHLSASTCRPVQALYLMRNMEGANLKMRIAEFAWLVKNKIRPSGLQRLGLPCQLMGTGMAFTWPTISAANLATGHIVEDMKLGLELARLGVAPVFCSEALVTSEFPTSVSGAQTQRTRWEHGHLSVILNEAPRLFWDSIKRRDLGLMAMACDLSIPPLALLALQAAALWVVGLVLFLLLHQTFAFAVTSTAASLIVAAIFLAWSREARHIISTRELASSVIYPVWKIPVYVKFLWRRQMDWVRSKRDGEQP